MCAAHITFILNNLSRWGSCEQMLMHKQSGFRALINDDETENRQETTLCCGTAKLYINTCAIVIKVQSSYYHFDVASLRWGRSRGIWRQSVWLRPPNLKFEKVIRLNIVCSNGTRPFDSTDSRIDNVTICVWGTATDFPYKKPAN